MPFPLHKSPRGLLELFRLRTLGKQPSQFGELVTPVADVSEFYAADLKVVSDSAAAVGFLSNLEDVLVLSAPVRLHAVGVLLVAGSAAATDVFMQVGVGFPFGGVVHRIGLASLFVPSMVAGQTASCATIVPGWILPPEWNIWGNVTGLTAAADNSVQVTTVIDNITGTI